MTPAEHWLLLQESVLRGLNHALSNRIGTVSAIASVLEPGPHDPLGASLALETRRLEEVLELLRSLPAMHHSAPEPVRIGDVVASAMALNAHRADVHECKCEVTWSEEPPPVLVGRSAVTHALLVMIAASCDVADGGVTRLHASSNANVVRLSVSNGARDWRPDGDTRATVEWLVRDQLGDDEGRPALVLETLTAARARERAR